MDMYEYTLSVVQPTFRLSLGTRLGRITCNHMNTNWLLTFLLYHLFQLYVLDPHPVQMEVPVEHPTPACAQLDGVVLGVQQVNTNLSHEFIQLPIIQLLKFCRQHLAICKQGLKYWTIVYYKCRNTVHGCTTTLGHDHTNIVQQCMFCYRDK